MTDKIAKYTRKILKELGYNLNDPHLVDSPERISRYLTEWHTICNEPPKLTVFPEPDYDQMIVQTSIPFDALCAHHGLPFHGHAAVGYIPAGNIVGLSKFSRVIDHFANRYTVQERVTMEITDYLEEVLMPRGLGVVLRAEHHCMKCRGVKKQGVPTITTELRGVFREDLAARTEFLGWVK